MGSTVALIEKEDVSKLVFPSAPVKITDAERKILLSQLERANTLGNIEHHKVQIYFEDSEGLKRVHTTVWAFTDKAVLLKQNVIIPIHRIIKLDI